MKWNRIFLDNKKTGLGQMIGTSWLNFSDVFYVYFQDICNYSFPFQAMKALASQNQIDTGALQRQIEEERSVTSYMEKEVNSLRTSLNETQTKHKELLVKAAKMKKMLNQLTRWEKRSFIGHRHKNYHFVYGPLIGLFFNNAPTQCSGKSITFLQ